MTSSDHADRTTGGRGQDALAPDLPDLATDPMEPMPSVRPGPESAEPPLAAPDAPSEIDLDWAPDPRPPAPDRPQGT